MRLVDCRNRGLKSATGDIVLWLDDDCIPCFWYMERLLEIHNEYPDCAFSAHRIMLHERKTDLNDANWEQMVARFDYRKLSGTKPMAHFNGFWDNTKDYPYGIYGNNLSVSRENANKVGGFIHYFGYGEEDIYWSYQANKMGIRGLYQKDKEKDLFVCHVNHGSRPHSTELASINRLWLYERDPEFKLACSNLRGDWTKDIVERILRDGLQSSPVYPDLLDIPDSLRKYVRQA